MTAPDPPPPADEQLRRSVETFYRFIDRQGLAAVSEACALMQLDRLVCRYPAAARESLRLLGRDGRLEGDGGVGDARVDGGGSTGSNRDIGTAGGPSGGA